LAARKKGFQGGHEERRELKRKEEGEVGKRLKVRAGTQACW